MNLGLSASLSVCIFKINKKQQKVNKSFINSYRWEEIFFFDKELLQPYAQQCGILKNFEEKTFEDFLNLDL
jgi:hypothetical protein